MTDISEPYAAPPAPGPPGPHGHGLRLRLWDPASETDVDAWLRGRTDPEFRRWNTPLRAVTDRESARASLRDKAAEREAGTSVTFCVTDAADATILGEITVNAISRVERSCNIGFGVLPEARGRQVATRALLLVTRWAVDELGLHRLELGHALGHEASCRIAERCGFRYEGTLRGAMLEQGGTDAFRDVHRHARLATDPEPRPWETLRG
ncbi:GNAT family N-acetyltransferase [Streptomyces sp. A012304]|uniref:GNAT family N-acetyltransferase n=1 Tax=Streptomyces sp. A012304 TaxID=375446 RepID=UPI00222EAE30|nr:GNAT family N-acetyltransferase [Streptomyces sp. A012304]GKQ36635.1 acetyltransferase [Streptomyces sp. A012304]